MKTGKEIMTAAHKIARTLEGDYSARMSMALEVVWMQELIEEDLTVARVHEKLMMNDYDAEYICKVVCFFSNGFQSDIAKRFIEDFNGKRISTKQAWCVAYEFKNVA